MKRFFGMILFVSVFFIGLGSLVEKTGAKIKSDEKALALIRAARQAIGGDSAIAGIQSLRIKGSTVNTWKIDGTEKTEPGETEIALQLPDKLSKTIKIGTPGGKNVSEQVIDRRIETVLVQTDKGENQVLSRGEGRGIGVGTEPGGKSIVIQKQDNSVEELKRDESGNVIFHPGDRQVVITTGDGARLRADLEKNEASHEKARQNELFRVALSLLLSSPAGIQANYTSGGESQVDGTLCNLVIAEFGGTAVKLYLDSGSNLPVMIAYTGEALPKIVQFTREAPAPGEPNKDVMFFARTNEPETTEMQTHFSDYRSVNGVQLPFHWSTTGGDMKDDMDVTSYDINPADIASSFENNKVVLRVKKEGQ
jgi:hypothetical protein